ncbi:MAG TPA: adenine phosphoribosyltransferase [Microbacteriaceae bacterium]|nr:adenine phosphoribosyltransferase [Microbacteriaceae bacterium]
MPTAAQYIESLTRTIRDFPRPGIEFKDLTPVLADRDALASVADALVAPFAGDYDVIAGIEARGFAFAAAAAARTGAGLVLIRKGGKLPGETHGEEYELEYGTDRLEVHVDQVAAGTRVLVVDDVLATGGTLGAAQTLIERAGWRVAGLAVVLELGFLGGRARLAPRVPYTVVRW